MRLGTGCRGVRWSFSPGATGNWPGASCEPRALPFPSPAGPASPSRFLRCSRPDAFARGRPLRRAACGTTLVPGRDVVPPTSHRAGRRLLEVGVPRPIGVLIADDDPFVARLVRRILSDAPDFEVL